MTELRITKGGDIRLMINGEELYGVTDFRAVSTKEGHEVYEYLSAEPCAVLDQREKHELKMTVLSLFRSEATEGSFTLSVIDGETRYDYEECMVTSCARDIAAGKYVTDKYTLRAERMRKRGIADDA